MMYNIHSDANRWQIPDFLMSLVMFALSLTIYKIFSIKKNVNTLTLKIKAKE